MIRAAALTLALFTAAPAFAWGHGGFGPRVRIGFAAPRVFVPPVVVAPAPYIAPAPVPYYGGYYARPYYGPRYAPHYGHFGRGWRR
jgi:hypothetical protein